MKKLSLFALVISFVFVSCKTTSSSTSSTDNTTEETEKKPTETSPKKPTDMKSLTYPTE